LFKLNIGGKSSPAGQLADLVIEGPFNDESKIQYVVLIYSHLINIMVAINPLSLCYYRFSELASVSDVLTVEIEHVNTEPLLLLETSGRSVQPQSSTIKLIQVITHLLPINI
jgi:hypothetical protein